ncbi:hypothetical protein OHA77_29235 [Streptosporangium sp. NBC_01639]|uniref:hypothetical protein n=1 Tax=unclassified Streptosporangium TaxID=2632669 RepID=UPI002DD7F8AB|nr:hypothetical protein [Streptosporangium sp. NBC_01756]WSC88585.1 hypothetical protein OIE48_10470 [Streptosporangium sp. NBC_01756]WTD52721.1 hypothetical protein OHA77_29235 [Streptosporangium sp. NBC_01639]
MGPAGELGEGELQVDRRALANAAWDLWEAADLLERHTDTLLASLAPSGRSPWGLGMIGMVMDQVNEMVGQACRHMHANIGQTGTGLQEMADLHGAVEHALSDAIRPGDAVPPWHGQRPSGSAEPHVPR